MAVKTFGVIGAGQMGNGIAQVAAYPGGLNVIMNDIVPSLPAAEEIRRCRLPGPESGQRLLRLQQVI